MTRRRPSRLAIVGRPSAQSSLSLRSTPFGAGGLDRASGPPRLGNYVMAGHSHCDTAVRIERKEVHERPETHAHHRGRDRAGDCGCITRSSRPHPQRSTHQRRSRCTPRLSGTCCGWPPLSSRSMPTRAKQPARLVLVDGSQFEWQEAKYKEAQHLFTPADPVLVGLEHTSALAVEPTSIAASRSRDRRGIGSEQLKVARSSETGPNLGGTS